MVDGWQCRGAWVRPETAWVLGYVFAPKRFAWIVEYSVRACPPLDLSPSLPPW